MTPSVTMPYFFTVCSNLLSQPGHHFYHFKPDSGHGGQTKDMDGDEIDGYDEG
jgi:hypothetical protein